MIKLLHFADAHIDIAAHGKHDPESGLPVRVLDFLVALDKVVETAIQEKVDLVIFAGDAYKDRSPSPTFQREWGRRMMRLSDAKIPTILVVGNHDVSPASGRANTLHEFDTLEVPHIHVIDHPQFLKPQDLEDLPVQVLGIPWVFRSSLMAALDLSGTDLNKVNEELELRLSDIMKSWLDQLDPNLPAILTAHGSVQGALYGNERTVMLGKDLVLPGSLLKDPRLDYVALGHIHKAQNVNEGNHPPVIYPGSIERVDFGEVSDEKFFVLAQIEHGITNVEFRRLNGRKFFDRSIKISEKDQMMEKILKVLPPPEQIKDSILRLVIDYPRELDVFLDDEQIRNYCSETLEFHLIRRPQEEARLRLPGDQPLASLSPMQMLNLYWESVNSKPKETDHLKTLAESIMNSVNEGNLPEEG